MSKTFEFEDIFQGKPLGEQARGAMFPIPGMPPNGKHVVVAKTPVGDRIARTLAGDGTPLSIPSHPKGAHVLTVRGWTTDGQKVVRHILYNVPTERDVTFVFAWRAGQYAIQCVDDRDEGVEPEGLDGADD